MIGDISQVSVSFDSVVFWSRVTGALLALGIVWLTRRRDRRLFVSWTGGVAAALLLIVAWSWTAGLGRVQAGARGVVLRFGAPTGRTLGEGLYYVVPFAERVAQVNTQDNTIRFDRTQATTADLEPVFADMAVTIHVLPDRAVDVYRQLRDNYGARIVRPAVADAFKATVSRYRAADLIEKRPEVQKDFRDEISSRIAPFGMAVDAVATTRFNFAYTYAQAAQLKVASVQRTLEAQQELQRIKFESEQSVVRAKSEVEALKLQRNIPITELIRIRRLDLERKAIEKWDGHLPQSTTTMPFLGGTLNQTHQD